MNTTSMWACWCWCWHWLYVCRLYKGMWVLQIGINTDLPLSLSFVVDSTTLSCTPPDMKAMHWLPQFMLIQHYSSVGALPLIYDALHPSRLQNNASLSEKQTHANLQLLEPFQLAMDLPGFDMTYHHLLNAVSTCGLHMDVGWHWLPLGTSERQKPKGLLHVSRP